MRTNDCGHRIFLIARVKCRITSRMGGGLRVSFGGSPSRCLTRGWLRSEETRDCSDF